MVDVGKMVRRVQAQYPPGTRTPRRLLQLWYQTQVAWLHLEPEVMKVRPLFGAEQQEAIVRDAKQFTKRLEAYKVALMAVDYPDAETEIVDTVTRGLLLNYPGSGHTTPDCVTPFTLANQVLALRKPNQRAARVFWGDLVEGLANIPAAAGKALGQAAGGILGGIAGSPLGWFALATASTVAGGLIVYKVTRGRRR